MENYVHVKRLPGETHAQLSIVRSKEDLCEVNRLPFKNSNFNLLQCTIQILLLSELKFRIFCFMQYIMKSVNFSDLPESQRQLAFQEAKLLQDFQHPHLIQCKVLKMNLKI